MGVLSTLIRAGEQRGVCLVESDRVGDFDALLGLVEGLRVEDIGTVSADGLHGMAVGIDVLVTYNIAELASEVTDESV